MKRITFELTLDVDTDVDTAELIASVKHMANHIDDAYDSTRLHMISLHNIVMINILRMETEKPEVEFIEGPISWEDAGKIAGDYELVLSREEKDGHELYIDKHKTIRWVENQEREKEIMALYNAADLNQLFINGAEKNDPIIRELYKCIGYSLCGFWEIFYWEANNELTDEYVAPATTPEK